MRALLEAMIRGEAEPPPVARLVGMRLVAVGDGEAAFELEADLTRHANPMGTVHGGVLCDVADGAMGCAYASQLGEGESFTTLELKINFLQAARSGLLTARARVVRRGRTIGLVECDVLDASGALVARASSTCMTLRAGPRWAVERRLHVQERGDGEPDAPADGAVVRQLLVPGPEAWAARPTRLPTRR